MRSVRRYVADRLISGGAGDAARRFSRWRTTTRVRVGPGRIVVGPGTYFGFPLPRAIVYPGDPPDPVTIGAYCSVASNLRFMLGGNHDPALVSTYTFPGFGGPRSKGPISVGSDVWIGNDVLILSGVTVGHGAVIGMRSVVTRDVRPYAIVAGNPARELRRRFSDELVERLLAAEWWTWPEQEVASIAHLLTSRDVEALLAYADERAARRAGPLTASAL